MDICNMFAMLPRHFALQAKVLSDFADKQPDPRARHNVKHNEKAVAK